MTSISFMEGKKATEFLKALGCDAEVTEAKDFYSKDKRSPSEALCAEVLETRRIISPVWKGWAAVLENGVLLMSHGKRRAPKKGMCVLSLPKDRPAYVQRFRRAGSWKRMMAARKPKGNLLTWVDRELLDNWDQTEEMLFLDFKPTRKEFEILDYLLGQEMPWKESHSSHSWGDDFPHMADGGRYGYPHFHFQDAMEEMRFMRARWLQGHPSWSRGAVARGDLAAIWRDIRSFRSAGNYIIKGSLLVDELYRLFSNKMVVTPASVSSPLGCFRFRNLRTNELADHPWELSQPHRLLIEWLRQNMDKAAFRKRIREKPVTAILPGTRDWERPHITIGARGKDLLVNGVRLGRVKALDYLSIILRGRHSKGAAKELLEQYSLYTLAEVEMLRGFPSRFVLGAGTNEVSLHVKPLKRGSQWYVEVNGEVFPSTLGELRRFSKGGGSKQFGMCLGMLFLADIGLPAQRCSEMIEAKIKAMEQADTKARELLSKIAADNPDRVRILRDEKGRLDVVVKGKLRDYLVRLNRTRLSVRRHPSGGHVCIDDVDANSSAVDRVISRVMALLNDKETRKNIHTLRIERNQVNQADDRRMDMLMYRRDAARERLEILEAAGGRGENPGLAAGQLAHYVAMSAEMTAERRNGLRRQAEEDDD